jgi:hypothetical protein
MQFLGVKINGTKPPAGKFSGWRFGEIISIIAIGPSLSSPGNLEIINIYFLLHIPGKVQN